MKIKASLKMTHEDFGPKGYIPSTNTVTGIAVGTLPTKLLRDTNIVDLVRTRETLTTGDFDSLKQDIKLNGIQQPLTIAIEKDNRITIIDGTHRLLAAEELGMLEVPVDVRFFGGVNKIHPGVLKDVEIENMSRQSNKTATRYKTIFYNIESSDDYEGITIYDTEIEATEAGKDWLKEDDFNDYSVYPIEDTQHSEIIKENKEASNLLKSLDKISYTMEDALNTNLKFTKLKKADIVEDYLQMTGKYKYNVICYDTQGNEKETKQFKDKHLAWIYGEYWKELEEGNTCEITDIITNEQITARGNITL